MSSRRMSLLPRATLHSDSVQFYSNLFWHYNRAKPTSGLLAQPSLMGLQILIYTFRRTCSSYNWYALEKAGVLFAMRQNEIPWWGKFALHMTISSFSMVVELNKLLVNKWPLKQGYSTSSSPLFSEKSPWNVWSGESVWGRPCLSPT